MLTICFHTFSLHSLTLTTAPAAKGMEMVPRCVRSCWNREIKIYLYTHPMLFPFTLALALALALSHSATLQQAAQGWIKLLRRLPVIGTINQFTTWLLILVHPSVRKWATPP